LALRFEDPEIGSRSSGAANVCEQAPADRHSVRGSAAWLAIDPARSWAGKRALRIALERRSKVILNRLLAFRNVY